MNATAPPSTSPAAAGSPDSLRDLFAAHIIAALIVAPKQPGVPKLEGDALAKQVYLMADSMIRARAG